MYVRGVSAFTLFPSMEPQLFSCGLLHWWLAFHSHILPSMEPQLFSCGLLKIYLIVFLSLYPSMEPQLFSCGLWIPHRPKKADRGRLQWSRNFSVADWSCTKASCEKSVKPSMEPQLFSCGLGQAGTSTGDSGRPFNGAATFQLRIVLWPCFWILACQSPSMEPQLFSCGLQMHYLFSRYRMSFLQWSRNFSVADCTYLTADETALFQPSMEPQLFSCGLLFVASLW